jgi:hypothetical protein
MLVILTLVGLLLVDQADLSGALQWLVRYTLAAAPILMPLGFFLSIASPHAESPNHLISASGPGSEEAVVERADALGDDPVEAACRFTMLSPVL